MDDSDVRCFLELAAAVRSDKFSLGRLLENRIECGVKGYVIPQQIFEASVKVKSTLEDTFNRLC